ncbi:hypothetical protein Wcon_01051 [Wolbachia endosymbiont of Cylisticus convexus]|uniref:hypothetical protein n=1 Tax=Wolbachia endosymbiont of Cylisticus convexus TaxID=118728 RepID=UPI000E153D0F|nr:hypothetical protein [Wolbachia endosymbiont of Cylisticus convexus]RDD34853.1 hypothetical protein Wcon_01051 [Wolbachia endosymbiont of Cylisticus convexus]
MSPLSKDKCLEEKVELIDQSVKEALNKFGQENSSQPSTYLDDDISVQSNVTIRQAR